MVCASSQRTALINKLKKVAELRGQTVSELERWTSRCAWSVGKIWTSSSCHWTEHWQLSVFKKRRVGQCWIHHIRKVSSHWQIPICNNASNFQYTLTALPVTAALFQKITVLLHRGMCVSSSRPSSSKKNWQLSAEISDFGNQKGKCFMFQLGGVLNHDLASDLHLSSRSRGDVQKTCGHSIYY